MTASPSGIRNPGRGGRRIRKDRAGTSGTDSFPGALVRATAHPRIQDPPAEAQALGRDFEQLVVVEILDELIQTHLAWRGEPVVDYFEGSALVDTG